MCSLRTDNDLAQLAALRAVPRVRRVYDWLAEGLLAWFATSR
jgi:hypothetical protein